MPNITTRPLLTDWDDADLFYVKQGTGSGSDVRATLAQLKAEVGGGGAPAGFITPLWPTGTHESIFFGGGDSSPFTSDLTAPVTYVRSSEASFNEVALPDATEIGHTKRVICMESSQGGAVAVSLISYDDFIGYIFEYPGQGIDLIWTGTGWRSLGAFGVRDGSLIFIAYP